MSAFGAAVDAWGPLAWGVTWQLGALALVAWLAERVLRVRDARVRHGLWWFVLLAPLVLTPGRLALQERQMAVRVALPRPVARAAAELPVALALQPASTSSRASEEMGLAAEARRRWRPDLRPVDTAALAWLLGCAALGVRLLVGRRRLARMLAASRSVEHVGALGLLASLCAAARVRRAVGLRSTRTGSPVVCGLRRPVVVVPRCWVVALAPAELRALLAHEVAHVKRRDFLANLVQRLIEIPLFFHPGAWLASRRIALAREELCDSWALSLGTDAASYARSLAAAAELTRGSFAPVSLGIAEGRSALLRRVETIMRMENMKRVSRPLVVAVMAVGLVSAIAFAAVQMREQSQSGVANTDRTTVQQLLSEMRNLAIAMQMYVQDSGDVFPPTDDIETIQVALAPYMGKGSQQIFTRKLRYLMPAGINLSQMEDPASTPMAVADDDPENAVVGYADGHVAKVPKGTNIAPVKPSPVPLVRTVIFSGRVVDERGRPIAGADVWLEVGSGAANATYPGPMRLFLSRSLGTTGKDGRFRSSVEIKPNLRYQHVGESWECAIIAHHAQHGAAWARVQGPKETIAVNLVMERGGDLRGQVVDPDGRAIPDASIQIREITLGTYPKADVLWIGGPEGPAWARVRSDARGGFSFKGLPAKANVHLTASPNREERRTEEWRPPDVIVDLATQRGVLPLRFNHPPVIEGALLLPNGKPAEGIRVSISTEWKITENRYGTSSDTVETDKQGHFTFSLYRPATCVVTVLDKGYYAVLVKDLRVTGYGQKVVLPAKTLQQGGTVEGRVLDADTGAPVKGLPVFCRPSPDLDSLGGRGTTETASTTDAEGHYHLVAPPGKANLDLSLEGEYMWNCRPVRGTYEGKSGLLIVEDRSRPTSRMLDIGTGAKLEGVDLFVRSGQVITGVVLGPGGKPQPGVRMNGTLDHGVVHADGPASPTFSSPTTDPEGGFALHALPEIPIVVSAFDLNRGLARAVSIIPTQAHSAHLTLQLLPLARVTGRVLMPDKRAAAHVQVDVSTIGAIPRPETDAQGRFNILRGVRGAPFTVCAYVFTSPEERRRGRPGLEFVGHSQPMEVPEGAKSLDVGDIVLESYTDTLRRERQNSG